MIQLCDLLPTVLSSRILASMCWGLRLLSVLLLCWGCLGLGLLSQATAADLSGQPAIEVQVSLSTNLNELKFVPNNLELAVGNRYKLVLTNPSTQKHYFTAKDFADAIWTQKVEAGNVEIKGAIHELELKPGARAEWVFVPVKPGSYSLRCPIAGHTEAGMTGIVTVSAAGKQGQRNF